MSRSASSLTLQGEVTVALVVGVALADLTREQNERLKSQASERGLVTVGVQDLSARGGRRSRAVVGLPVQLAYARLGAQEVDREDLQEAIVQMAQRDMDWLREYDEGRTPRRSVHMIASGPMASGVVVLGELRPRQELQEGVNDGTFVLGTDMENMPHREGIRGRTLAFASWERSALATIAADRYESLFDEAQKLYLVPSYDV